MSTPSAKKRLRANLKMWAIERARRPEAAALIDEIVAGELRDAAKPPSMPWLPPQTEPSPTGLYCALDDDGSELTLCDACLPGPVGSAAFKKAHAWGLDSCDLFLAETAYSPRASACDVCGGGPK